MYSDDEKNRILDEAAFWSQRPRKRRTTIALDESAVGAVAEVRNELRRRQPYEREPSIAAVARWMLREFRNNLHGPEGAGRIMPREDIE